MALHFCRFLAPFFLILIAFFNSTQIHAASYSPTAITYRCLGRTAASSITNASDCLALNFLGNSAYVGVYGPYPATYENIPPYCFINTNQFSDPALKGSLVCVTNMEQVIHIPTMDSHYDLGQFQVFLPPAAANFGCNSGDSFNSNSLKCSSPSTKNNGHPKELCEGNPINIGTGNKFQAEIDFQGSGGMPLVFERFYNSDPSAINTM